MEDESFNQSQESENSSSSQEDTDDQTSESSTKTLMNLSASSIFFSQETGDQRKSAYQTKGLSLPATPPKKDSAGSSSVPSLPFGFPTQISLGHLAISETSSAMHSDFASLDTSQALALSLPPSPPKKDSAGSSSVPSLPFGFPTQISLGHLAISETSSAMHSDFASFSTSQGLGAPQASVCGFSDSPQRSASEYLYAPQRSASGVVEATSSTTSQESGAGLALRGISNMMDFTEYLDDKEDSNKTDDALSGDSQNDDSLNVDHELMRLTNDSTNSDEDTSISDLPVLNNPAVGEPTVELQDFSEAVTEVAANAIRLYDPVNENLVDFTLASLNNLFTPSLSYTGGAATPARRTNLLYKAVYDANFDEYSETLDPDVLKNGAPGNRLEEECLCDDCLIKIDDRVAACLGYLFKVFRNKCPKCTYEDRMKEYQIICYSCSRVENICFHCGKNAIFDNKDVLNFYALFTEEKEHEFFRSLRQEQRRHIIYQIYREWDTNSSVQKYAIIKKLLDVVLKNLRLVPDLHSANPLI